MAGSIVTIEQGKLSIIVGGSPDAFERVEPILRDIGPFVRHVGENGKALELKLALNINIYLQMVAFSEGLVLAERAGLDKELAVDVMLNSVIASPMLQYEGRSCSVSRTRRCSTARSCRRTSSWRWRPAASWAWRSRHLRSQASCSPSRVRRESATTTSRSSTRCVSRFAGREQST